MTNQMSTTSYVDVRKVTGHARMEMNVSRLIWFVMATKIAMMVLMNLSRYANEIYK